MELFKKKIQFVFKQNKKSSKNTAILKGIYFPKKN